MLKFFILISFFAEMAISLPLVVPSELVKKAPDCAELVSDTEMSLLELGAEGGKAILGYPSELASLFVAAGVSPLSAPFYAAAFRDFREFLKKVPTVNYTIDTMVELEHRKMLFFCMLSNECNLASVAENHVTTIGHHNPLMILPPPSPSGLSDWMISLFGSAGAISAERFLIEWLAAGFALEKLNPGSADPYYRRFASNYDGTPRPESLRPGFAVTFLTLNQMLVSQAAFTYFYPNKAERNRNHLASSVFDHLTKGRNGALTKPVCDALGITTVEKVFEEAEKLQRSMYATWLSGVSRN